MKNRAIIEADFATFRPVAGRKVLQLVFEIPIENAEKAMGILGYPVPGQSKWCAIALLALEAEKPVVDTPSGKLKRKFEELPYSAQAAIRCDDPEFQAFIANQKGLKSPAYEGEVAQWVRFQCGVKSRSELDDTKNDWPRSRWQELESEYQSYLTTQKYGEARR